MKEVHQDTFLFCNVYRGQEVAITRKDTCSGDLMLGRQKHKVNPQENVHSFLLEKGFAIRMTAAILQFTQPDFEP